MEGNQYSYCIVHSIDTLSKSSPVLHNGNVRVPFYSELENSQIPASQCSTNTDDRYFRIKLSKSEAEIPVSRSAIVQFAWKCLSIWSKKSSRNMFILFHLRILTLLLQWCETFVWAVAFHRQIFKILEVVPLHNGIKIPSILLAYAVMFKEVYWVQITSGKVF